MKKDGKLRRWLIKKLGGLSIDELAAEPRYVSKYTKVPIKIRASAESAAGGRVPIEYRRERLAAEMATGILKHCLYTERREIDYDAGVDRIEWTVEIIPPERMEDE